MSQQPQPQLYTVKVTETGGREHKWINLSKDKVEQLKASIWKCGCLVRRNENTQELISPYMLREVLIISQKGEVSGTMETVTNYSREEKK